MFYFTCDRSLKYLVIAPKLKEWAYTTTATNHDYDGHSNEHVRNYRHMYS